MRAGDGTRQSAQVPFFLCIPCGTDRGGTTAITLPPLLFVVGRASTQPFPYPDRRGALMVNDEPLDGLYVSWQAGTVLVPGTHYAMEHCVEFVPLCSKVNVTCK